MKEHEHPYWQEHKHVRKGLETLGNDTGMSFKKDSAPPKQHHPLIKNSEKELADMSPKNRETLAIGEEKKRAKLAQKAPHADKLFESAFDGPLKKHIYE
jgi:hypothetical protein